MPRPPRHQPIQSNTLATSEGPSPNQRLPVNPRRKKVAPDQRKRVATACNRCNQKRVKCSGDNPCRQCVQGARECIYPPPVEKVTVTKTELEEYQATSRDYHVQSHRLRALERLLEESGIALPPEPARAQTPPPGAGEGDIDSPSGSSPLDDLAMTGIIKDDPDADDIPEQRDQGKLLTDGEGIERFLGETSGASYLDGVKEFIVTSQPLTSRNYNSTFLDSRGRYQTFDSRPINLPSVDANLLPPPTERASMLAEISVYIQDGNGTFPSGGMFYWPWKDLDTIVASLPPPSSSSSPSPPSGVNRHLALYHVAFAFSSHLRGQPSDDHFARARLLIGNPLDITLFTLDDVPVLALMALYLVESNRRDAAYICISNAIHISIMYGTHTSSHGSHSVDEGRRRIFWTTYIIDRWLSCLMGRPPTIPEEAVKLLPYPQEVVGFPNPSGLDAHIQLANISHEIVSHSYRTGLAADKVREIMDTLVMWKQNLPDELKLNEADLEKWEKSEDSTFSCDRARLSLHMLYNQLNILAVRPAFLSAVKKLVAARYLDKQWITIDTCDLELDLSPDLHSASCFRRSSNCARVNLHISMLIKQRVKAPGNKLLVADLHYIFNAAIILLMYRISFINARTKDTVYLNFAKEVFEEEAKSGSEYGKDCLDVLVDMDSMVEGLREIIHWTSERQCETWSNSTSPSAVAGPWSGQTPAGPMGLGSEGDLDFQQRLERLTSWRENDPWQEDDYVYNQQAIPTSA